MEITNIRNETGDIITDPVDIKRTIRKYHKTLYTYILDTLDEMDHFFKQDKLS